MVLELLWFFISLNLSWMYEYVLLRDILKYVVRVFILLIFLLNLNFFLQGIITFVGLLKFLPSKYSVIKKNHLYFFYSYSY